MDDKLYLQRSRDVRHLLNGEWISDIVMLLGHGPMRYSEVMAKLRAASEVDPWTGAERSIQGRQLTRTLRRLEEIRLVNRNEEPGHFPRRVTYSLTEAARELLLSVEPFVAWAERHSDLIDLARRMQTDQRGGAPQSLPDGPDDDYLDE
ncbi:helix-turn-helix transcriptional regulator [Solihabitans fulvus]|uniref:Helix-turn-helix transcriptional regulator n=1 Tax=Solihabitans fulvus TaxID=1892852 RepID=A0A5B2WQX9_9PSEU|nr:helix-turn-helix domain-containing protein [Solihabitans fulvus]KAA2252377.1 helix-turn-helix transcriptional regulator [Solihabitans fulvus]